MKYRTILCSVTLALILVLLFGAQTSADQNTVLPSMKIYYVPFDVAPYGPITIDVLEKRPNYAIWFYGKHLFIDAITNTLEKQRTKKPFDNDVARLMVFINRKGKTLTYYVDKSGVVWKKETNEFYILSEKDKLQLDNDILNYRGVVDQQPQIDPWGDYLDE